MLNIKFLIYLFIYNISISVHVIMIKVKTQAGLQAQIKLFYPQIWVPPTHRCVINKYFLQYTYTYIYIVSCVFYGSYMIQLHKDIYVRCIKKLQIKPLFYRKPTSHKPNCYISFTQSIGF